MQKPSISRRDLLKSGTALATTAALPSWSFASGSFAYAAQTGGGPADPPLVAQIGSRQYPSKDDIRKGYEDFLYARAVQAYMMTLPILNTIGMRDGSEGTFRTRLQRAAHLEGLHERQNLGADAQLRCH